MLYNIVRLRTSKKCDNRFSEINNKSVSVGIASGNEVSKGASTKDFHHA